MNTALILGASGFIGRHVARRFEFGGWEVVRTTRALRSTGHDMIALGQDLSLLPGVVADTKPSVIVNLAAAGVNPARTGDTLTAGNSGVVHTVFDAVDAGGTDLVIHAGSWSQYKPPYGDQPITEAYPRIPTTDYGMAKELAEESGFTRARRTSCRFVSLRLFNVYGPGEGEHRLLPSVVESILGGVSLDLTNGDQVRDFVHVSDVAEAFYLAAGLRPQIATAYNIATGVGTRVRDVVLAATHELGGSTDLLGFGSLPSRVGEPAYVVGDASRFMSAAGWRASVDVWAGVAATVRSLAAP